MVTVKCIEDEIPIMKCQRGGNGRRLRSIIHFIRNGATIKQYGDAKGLPYNANLKPLHTGINLNRNRFGVNA